jgi:hypothetical protein
MVEELGDGGSGSAEPDWTVIQQEVRAARDTRLTICHRHNISLEVLAEHIRSHKWSVPEERSVEDRALLVRKLLVGLEQQMEGLKADAMGGTSDKVATLQKLTTTLDKLLEIERSVTGNRPPRRQSREMQELRAKIAKRLDELKIS